MVKIISSAEFRKSYAKLTEPTVVTVNGHPIGEWWPGPVHAIVGRIPTTLHKSHEAGTDVTARKAQQTERDAILRKIIRKD